MEEVGSLRGGVQLGHAALPQLPASQALELHSPWLVSIVFMGTCWSERLVGLSVFLLPVYLFLKCDILYWLTNWCVFL